MTTAAAASNNPGSGSGAGTDRSATADLHTSRYGRARLWLGIGTVGLHVTLAASLLGFGVLDRLHQSRSGAFGQDLALLAVAAVLFALVQLPSDLLGGYVLPKRHNRTHPPLTRFVRSLARGVGVYTATWLGIAIILLVAARLFGIAGVFGVGILTSLALLAARPLLARSMARLELHSPGEARARVDHDAPTTPNVWVRSGDEAFTGGVVGVVRPCGIWMPDHWRSALTPPQLELVARRRNLILSGVEWRRGRLGALVFTWVGLMLSAIWVGPDGLTSGAGMVMLAMAFTLWSFVGLLTLPTLSRAGVASIDRRWRAQIGDDDAVDEVIRALDRLQDDEPIRPSGVEMIFHPVPSASNRSGTGPGVRWPACLDVARTSVFLGLAGLGFLGRAVHCNCGRPDLWAYLPSD